MKRQHTAQQIQMATKIINKCSSLLVVKKFKVTMKNHFPPIRVAKSKNADDICNWQRYREKSTPIYQWKKQTTAAF